MEKKIINQRILTKLVRDNSLHKIIAGKFNFTEKRVEQWFYRAASNNNIFCKIYTYSVIKEIANYLKISIEELFENELHKKI